MDRLYLATAGLSLKTSVRNGKQLARIRRIVNIPKAKESRLRVTLTGHPLTGAPARVSDSQTVSSRRTYSTHSNGWVYLSEMRVTSSPQMMSQVGMIKKIGQKIEGNQMRLLSCAVTVMPEASSAH